MKELHKINLRDAPVLGAQAKAYLRGELNELIAFSPDLKGFEKAIATRNKFPVNRNLLADVLTEQNKNAGAETLKNIALLRKENTFTVTTGHQLCLFTGPLYFIYKILHTIRMAEELKKQFAANNFVPVYWMASEDHDFAEISEVNLFGKKLKWEANVKGAVGRIGLHWQLNEGGLKPVMGELKAILGETEKAREIFGVIEKCYSQANLSEASRMLVNYLMGEYGLVIIDADDARLKKCFTDIFVKEIEEEFVIKAVSETNLELEKKKFKTQVTPREINVFYLQENSRERLVRDNEVYTTADYSRRWTQSELLQEMKLFPENFSPNVLMRALYQESILPNLAYVGGGGEISYWMQMKKMFEAAMIFFPVLMVRDSFLLVDAVQKEKIEKFGFSVSEFLEKEEVLINRFIDDHKTAELDFKAEDEKIKNVYNELAKNIAKIDPTLQAATEAEMQKTLKSLESLEARVRKAEKVKHDQSLNQIKGIKSKLYPNGEFQERHDNFLPFWLKSDGKLIQELYGVMGGAESELRIVSI